MISNEFVNYFRLCVNRALSTQETLTLFLEVSGIARTNINEEVSMLYRMDNETNQHCYDIKLKQNISQAQAESILTNLKSIFVNDSLDYTISE
jgi:hypothetical protein